MLRRSRDSQFEPMGSQPIADRISIFARWKQPLWVHRVPEYRGAQDIQATWRGSSRDPAPLIIADYQPAAGNQPAKSHPFSRTNRFVRDVCFSPNLRIERLTQPVISSNSLRMFEPVGADRHQTIV